MCATSHYPPEAKSSWVCSARSEIPHMAHDGNCSRCPMLQDSFRFIRHIGNRYDTITVMSSGNSESLLNLNRPLVGRGMTAYHPKRRSQFPPGGATCHIQRLALIQSPDRLSSAMRRPSRYRARGRRLPYPMLEHFPLRLTMAGITQARRELLLHLNRWCRSTHRFNLFGVCSSTSLHRFSGGLAARLGRKRTRLAGGATS